VRGSDMAKWSEEKIESIMSNNTSMIVVNEVVEHEDGSATYSFDMDPASTKRITELGLEFLLYCAAYGMDIQDALSLIAEASKAKDGVDAHEES